MSKRMLIMVVAILLLFGLIYGWNTYKGKLFASADQGEVPVVTVTAIRVRSSRWQPQVDAVGGLRAVRGADLAPQMDGLVSKVEMRSGQTVSQGQVLLELNTDTDRAQLEALRAASDLAAAVLERSRAQYAVQAISKAQLDADSADLRAKRALVVEQSALIEKKLIKAPFAGRLGISKINPGQYLTAGTTVVTLQTIDPIYVDFYLPQQQLSAVMPGQYVTLSADAYPAVKFSGKVTAVNSKVDEGTRNVALEALVQNPEQQLRPGMFVRLAVDVGAAKSVLTLPQTAITYNPYGATVFVIKPNPARKAVGDGKPPALVAEQVFVTAGATRGDQVEILGGLQDGETVVTSGGLKLKNGTAVAVDNRIVPKNDPNPTPQEG